MNWNNFIAQVSEGAKGLCVDSLSNLKGPLENDIKNFLEKTKLNFEQWSQQLAEGKLSKEDYESLVRRQLAGTEFIAIKQAGIAKIELEKLTSGLVKMIIDSAFRLIF